MSQQGKSATIHSVMKHIKRILLLPVIAFTALHMVFVGSVRYRVPVMPMVMVLSAMALATLWERVRTGASGSPDVKAQG